MSGAAKRTIGVDFSDRNVRRGVVGFSTINNAVCNCLKSYFMKLNEGKWNGKQSGRELIEFERANCRETSVFEWPPGHHGETTRMKMMREGNVEGFDLSLLVALLSYSEKFKPKSSSEQRDSLARLKSFRDKFCHTMRDCVLDKQHYEKLMKTVFQVFRLFPSKEFTVNCTLQDAFKAPNDDESVLDQLNVEQARVRELQMSVARGAEAVSNVNSMLTSETAARALAEEELRSALSSIEEMRNEMHKVIQEKKQSGANV